MLVELERKIEDLTGKQKTEFPSTPHKSGISSKSSQSRWQATKPKDFRWRVLGNMGKSSIEAGFVDVDGVL